MSVDSNILNHQRGFTLLEIMIVVSIIGLLTTLALPGFIKPRKQAQRDVCIQHLRLLGDAKNLWALDENQPGEALPTSEELDPYIRGGTEDVVCPVDTSRSFSTSYEIKSVNERPVCISAPTEHVF
jgi:prepilin-type N-terminal cleavage/methylation domain-containing protein